MSNLKKSIIFFIFFFISFQCEKNSIVKDSIIAHAGQRTIDWKLVHRNFELNPQWKKGVTQKQAYLKQLDYLINEKLFAQAAISDGLLRDSLLAGYLKFIQEKELVKELYRREVASRVEISEQEYQDAYQKLKRQVKFTYVYTPSFSQAEQYAQELKTKTIEEIQLSEPTKDMKGTTPFIAYGELRPEVEEKVFTLAPGEISAPLAIDNGYMVVKVIDGRVDLFMSELDFAERKNKIQKVIFERKAEKVSNAYVKELMADKDLQLNPPVFFALSQEFSRIIKNKFSAEPIPIYVNDSELQEARDNLSSLLPQTLITFRGGQMTVAEFLRELSYMPPDFRPNLKMAPQLKDAIGVIVRNKYLANEARKKKLDKADNVKWEIQVQSDEILARYWVQKKSQHIIVTADEIESFKHSADFLEFQKNSSEEIDDQLIYNFLYLQKLSHYKGLWADSLKTKYTVKIDTSRLVQNLKNPEMIIKENPVPMIVRELYY